MSNRAEVRFHTAADLARAIPPIQTAEQASQFFDFVTTHGSWFAWTVEWGNCHALTPSSDGKVHLSRNYSFVVSKADEDVITIPDPKAVTRNGDTFVIQRSLLCGFCQRQAILRQFIIGGKTRFQVKQRPLNAHVYHRPCRID